MHTSRREFFTLITTTALGAHIQAKPLGIPIGIQPYTVRNELAKDPEGTTRQLALMGYEAIEISIPFNGLDAAKVRALLKSLKMIAPAGSFGGAKNESEWARSIEAAKSLGAKYIGVSAPQDWTKSLDGCKRTAERFNKLGEQSKKAGVTAIYHNHNWEYRLIGGVVAYDELLKQTDPKLVQMEIDIFWTTIAGKDPIDYFNRYPGRFPVWHLKDLKAGFGPTTEQVAGQPFAPIGGGTINWKRIFSGAKKAGLKYYFVEQDRWDTTPLESAKASCDFLKKFKP
jgi:sugar phosphate isomerase/epimerase